MSGKEEESEDELTSDLNVKSSQNRSPPKRKEPKPTVEER